ncbi:hypothetical protein [Clostridium sp. MD294]|uniref:hypothetical protein n=1 Tax=Clostridium sp. MD294 TaxID=97138 RepID=UPI0002C9D5DB|nr:hypothetical protein [Clostridium sp. MD294]NDO47558.1 hypothetical protein [Clostridium sp. MD294]USF29368.1 hypothetical protein C820_000758 [Clostridium sp. MD294]
MSNIFNKTFLKRFIPVLLLRFLFVVEERSFTSFVKSFILCFIIAVISQIKIDKIHLFKRFIRQLLFFFFMPLFAIQIDHYILRHFLIGCTIAGISSLFDVAQTYGKSSSYRGALLAEKTKFFA